MVIEALLLLKMFTTDNLSFIMFILLVIRFSFEVGGSQLVMHTARF